eukprot:Selendium_serpulae@DN5707_c0_g1_i1.p1
MGGRAPRDKMMSWFKKDEKFDALIRQQFESELKAVVSKEREHWLSTTRGALAQIIVLDQFSRNMYRGTPGMFSSDAQALRVAMELIDRGDDRKLAFDERSFVYTVLMHSEDLKIQEKGVELFEKFIDEHDEQEEELRNRLAGSLKFAVAHRDIIQQWGRFPHRNEILNRESTPDEIAFLKQPGSSF